MCGIIGYAGRKPAAPIILEALKMLEYRGYDSAGIATADAHKINLKKDKGRLDELSKKLRFEQLQGNIGIGHTRWATHGAPSHENAHPHVDCAAQIAIVHNGIIENYQELKRELEKRGHKFKSETDSEVAAHILEEESAKVGMETAFRKLVNTLSGAFAILAVRVGEGRIFASKHGSPLVLGIGRDEMFFASDIPALLKHTREVLPLEDMEIAIISPSDFRVEKRGVVQNRKPMHVSWTLQMAQKGGYEHFTLKEIEEQPAALEEGVSVPVEAAASLVRAADRVEVIAAGSSYHAGLAFKLWLQKHARKPVDAIIASEYSAAPVTTKRDLVVAISQSGETIDTLFALKQAKKSGAKTLGVVNVSGSSIARESDVELSIGAGPEIGVVATKTFSNQLAVLAKTAFETGGREDLQKKLHEVPALSSTVLQNVEHAVRKLASELKERNDFFFIGRGLSAVTSMEGALKLKEISYARAEAYPAGELKHGPLALMHKGAVVIATAPGDEALEKTISNIKETKARDAFAVVLSDDDEALRAADVGIRMPRFEHELSPLLYSLPLQLFAYHMAVARGHDVDKPRNIAKTLTVE